MTLQRRRGELGRTLARGTTLKTLVWLATMAAIVLFGIYVLKPLTGIREAGWHFKLPPIGRGMPLAHRDEYLTGRLQSAFPVSTPQARVMGELKHQGFELDAPGAQADYKWINLFCLCRLRVHWYASGREGEAPIQKIDGEVLELRN